MATTNLTIRIDSDLKEQLKKITEEMGMDITTFFTVYAKQVVRTREVPFKIAAKEIPNDETKKAIEDVRNGKNLSKGYTSVDELMEDLLNDDD